MDYKPTPEEIKQVREKTGAGIIQVRDALLAAAGNVEDAIKTLVAAGAAKAGKLAGRAAEHGRVDSYVHFNGKVGAMVKVGCNTDFVANSDSFKEFCQQLAQQVAMGLEGPLEDQQWLRGEGMTVEQARADLAARTGENIVILSTMRETL